MAKLGFNFRSSDTYVTDVADTTYVVNDAYPTTRAMVTSGQSCTFGWDGAITTRLNRSTGVDVRLAGVHYATGASPANDRLFRIDLPSAGTYSVRLAAGNVTFTSVEFWQILDSDGTTVLASQAEATTTTGQLRDITGSVHADAAAWVSSNTASNLTFSGTTAWIKVKGSVTDYSSLAHLSFETVTGATVSTITGTTATEASAVVFTVNMSGTGGLTAAYSWSGTAGAADYTQTLTDGMFTPTGGSGSVTVSGGNIVVPSAVTAFTVTVPTTTDTIDESDETIRLVFGGVTSSSGTINDDDAMPDMVVSDAPSVTAGSPAVFTISLDRAKSSAITVDAACVDGTLVGGVGYTSDLSLATISNGVTFGAGALTIPAGVTSFTVSIPTAA